MSELISEELLIKVGKIIGGDEAVQIILALRDLGEATDDQIMAKTGIGLNEIRKVLFKLHNHSIVQCTRERDQNSGWFTFRWNLQPDQVEGFILSQKNRILNILNKRLEYEKSHDFYNCNTPRCRRVTFEDAMELVFRCPNCEEPLQPFDNSKIVQVLEEKILKLRKEIVQ